MRDGSNRLAEGLPQRYAVPAKPEVLVADDDPEMRRLLARLLGALGLDVAEVPDGLSALERLQGDHPQPSLVVSDVRMPGCSGLDLLEAIRQGVRRVPVVLISAFADREVHRQARLLGAFALLEKPFRLDDLRAVVFAALEAR